MSCPRNYLNEISTISIKPSLRSDPSIGSKIIVYDQVFVWTSEHVPPSKLNQWRYIGDPIIDHFFEQYGEQLKHHADTYLFLEELTLKNSEHICNQICENNCLISFTKDIRQRPIWFDKNQIRRGQEFFLKYSPLPSISIFFYTLILGYGFQQLNNVLIRTQYLSSINLFETYRRLQETFQMIVHAVIGDVDKFDETFIDVIRVRLLHGMVRYKLKKSIRSSSHQIPINQEDSLITLLGFSFAVLQCMEERIGVYISDEDKQAYLHLWRYIGWLIGIRDEYLIYFSSYQSTRIISESIFYHFYLPSPMTKHFVHHSMMGYYLHTNLPFSFMSFNGISQRLLGEQISEALGIDRPKPDFIHRCFISFCFQIFRFYGWLIGLNLQIINRRLISYRRILLKKLLEKELNYQLRNFALFQTYDSLGEKSDQNCPCNYYQKEHEEIVKTNDFYFIRARKSSAYLPFIIRVLGFILFICF